MTTSIFTKIQTESQRHNEHNDCTVKAMTILTGINYSDMHQLIGTHCNRPNRSGPNWFDFITGLNTMGFDLIARPYVARTMITLEREFRGRKGSYLVAMSGGRHVAALKDGILHDWSKQSRKRMYELWEVRGVQSGVGTTSYNNQDLARWMFQTGARR